MVALNLGAGMLRSFKKRVEVKLSDLKGFFYDHEAVVKTLSGGRDLLIYEYYENPQPEIEGNLNFGVTIINPGKVGIEYYMTRGHYHAKQHAAEIYVGLKGEGMVIMQTKGGQLAHMPIRRNDAIYIPAFWAHRTVNVSSTELAFLYAYPSGAGHDYDVIKHKGFAKLVVERQGQPKVIANPRFIKG